MYGYEITQRVKELSDGRIQLTEGALYPLLHRLEEERLLKTETVLVSNRKRKYYALTAQGRAQAKDLVSEFIEFMRTMSSVLQVKMG